MATIVGELGVDIQADSTNLAADIHAKVEAAVREAATSQIALGIDQTQLVREIRDALAEAQRIAGNIVVKMDLDTVGFAEQVKIAVAAAQAAARNVKLGFNIDVTGLAVKVKAATELAAKEATIEPKVEPKTAERDFDTLAKDIKSKASDLSKGLSGALATASTAVFQAAKWSSIVVGVAQISQSLITLAGAAGLIPGAILAAGGAIAALKIGTIGFGQAIKDIGTPQFTKDMANLAPAARDTVSAIAGLKGAFTSLRLDVQQTLFQGLGNEVRSLGSTLLPVLRSGLAGFADSLNITAVGVAEFFKSASVQSDLAQTFNSAQAAVFNLGGAVPFLLSAFRDIGVVGAEAFANLTGGAAAAAGKFSDFIGRVRETGQLAAFIDAGVQSMRQLGQIVANVVSIFFTLSNAIGGGGILGLLDSLTSGLRAFLATAAGQSALAGLSAALNSIASAAGGVLLELLTQVGKILADNGVAIGTFAKALGQDLVTAIDTVAPILGGIISAIGQNPELFANLAIGVGVFAVALQAIIPIGTAIVALIGLGIPGLVIAIIAAVVAGVVLVIANFDKIKAAIGIALDAIGGFFSNIGQGIAAAFQTAVSFVVGIWNGVVSFFVGIGTAIGSAVSSAVTAIGQFFTDGFNAVVAFVSGAINSVVTFFVNLPGQIGAFIAGIPAAVGAMTAQLAFDFGFAIGAILRFFIDLPGNVIAAVTSLVTDIGTWAINVWATTTIAFETGVANVINFVLGFPSMVINAVTSLVTAIGAWAFQVWFQTTVAFETGVAAVINFVINLPGQVISAVQNLIIFIRVWAEGVWGQAKGSFVQGAANVINFVTSLPGNVVSAIGDLSSRLFRVGIDALTGLLHGLQSIASNIIGWVKGLVGDILSGFTHGFDSHSPSRETYSIGQDVAQGLANALRDSRALVASAATDLANAGLAGLSPLLNPTVDTSAIANGLASSAASGVGVANGLTYQVNQTNVMQQGTDVNQFANQVFRQGAAALAAGSTLLSVAPGSVQSGIAGSFIPAGV